MSNDVPYQILIVNIWKTTCLVSNYIPNCCYNILSIVSPPPLHRGIVRYSSLPGTFLMTCSRYQIWERRGRGVNNYFYL